MKIACVGAGPGGLYLAILMKLRNPTDEVTVYERNLPGVIVGWGVTLADDVMLQMKENDLGSFDEIVARSCRFDGFLVGVEGKQVADEGGLRVIGRHELIEILANRATQLGVNVRYGQEIVDPGQLENVDLIVAADGVRSQLRKSQESHFGTTVQSGRNKFVWLGTNKVFTAFTFDAVLTKSGWVWFYAYGFDKNTSTFIAECAPETWKGLGFDKSSVQQSLEFLQQLFERSLDGHPLLTQGRDNDRLPWLNFQTVTNASLHTNKMVLLGDAAHTAHFSIGSGTRLAIQDAIVLANSLCEEKDVGTALGSYQRERQPVLKRFQTEARRSAQWYENFPRYAGLEIPKFVELMKARQSRLVHWIPPRVFYYLRFEDSALLRILRATYARTRQQLAAVRLRT